jgi:preprotein translocase subunit SecD
MRQFNGLRMILLQKCFFFADHAIAPCSRQLVEILRGKTRLCVGPGQFLVEWSCRIKKPFIRVRIGLHCRSQGQNRLFQAHLRKLLLRPGAKVPFDTNNYQMRRPQMGAARARMMVAIGLFAVVLSTSAQPATLSCRAWE